MKMIARKTATIKRRNVDPRKCRTIPPKITTAIAVGIGIRDEGTSESTEDCGRCSSIEFLY
jgi:hypothetical protein